jgi:restriction system protein
MRKKTTNVPTFDNLFNPALHALKALGGSGTIEEINQKVIDNEHISDEISAIPHKDVRNTDGNTSETEIGYRLAWARTYLKKYGLLENSSRGIWSLTPAASKIDNVDPLIVKKFVLATIPKKKLKVKSTQVTELNAVDDTELDDMHPWKQQLLDILLKMSPDGFERLTQRILRESGFTQVEVTGKSGDGGIDGKGIARINGLLSFHVLFQCKKYKSSVTPNLIRDFRGAMQGRADKGLFITTGSFTRDAIKEATRDGAPAIDLVDGDQLAEKLKELGLGLKKTIVEKIDIDEKWFNQI